MGYRLVRVNRELFTEMMTEGWTMPNCANECIRCVKGLPPGARLEDIHLYFNPSDIVLKFWHDSWPEPGTGAAIPVLDVQYKSETTEPTGFFDIPAVSDEQRAALEAAWDRCSIGPPSARDSEPLVVEG